MFTMCWDPESKRFEDANLLIKIETGTSMKINNRMTRLRLSHPEEAKAIHDEMMAVATRLSQTASDSAALPGVPEIVRYSRRTSWGRFTAYMVYGIVLNGAKKKGARIGAYRFVIVAGGELPDCLSSVFELERTLVPYFSNH